MAQPDIFLGPGDTAPISRFAFRAPNNPDGTPGALIPMAGATAILRYQPRNESTDPVARTITPIDPPDADGFNAELDWLQTGGPIPPGDYDARAIATLPGGYQISIPNGAPPGEPIDDEFLWLHVARDFVTL